MADGTGENTTAQSTAKFGELPRGKQTIVDKDGNAWEIINDGSGKVKLANINGDVISPATEGKQDDVIAELKIANKFIDDQALISFTNPILGRSVHLANPGFTGTPEMIHDGLDQTLWTASNLTGSNFVFTSTTHAKQAIATVVDFSLLSGDAMTINGTNITNTTVTEGVEWTASVDNATTATSLASAINAVAGVSATASGAVVTVIADDTVTQADITTFTSTDGTNLPVSAQSVDGSSTVNDDEALFTAPSDIDFNNFSTLSFFTYIVDWSVQGGAKEVQIRFRNSGTDVGNSVVLNKFLDIGSFNFWQAIFIAKTEFGIAGETVNEFVVKTVDIGTGPPPSVFFDRIQIEESGAPVTFSITPPPGFTFRFQLIQISTEGPANGITSIDNVPSDRFYMVNALANGWNTNATLNNTLFEGEVIRDNRTLLRFPGVTFQNVSTFIDQSTVQIVSQTDVLSGVVLKSSTGDKIDQVFNDDMTNFTFFNLTAIGVLSIET